MSFIGYGWHIKDGSGIYCPTEELFPTFSDALNDGHRAGYDSKYIAIDKIENDDGFCTVLEHCKDCEEFYYDDEMLDDMINYFEF